MKKILLILVLFTLLLSACDTQDPQAAASPEATTVPSLEEPTPEPTEAALTATAEPTEEPAQVVAEPTADTGAGAVDVTTVCDAGEDFTECDGGPRVVVGEVSSGNFAFMPALFPNPSVLLFDMTNIIGGRPEVFVSESGQILGIFTEDLFPQPGKFSISLPIEPTGAYLDVDNDGVEEQGVQIYALQVSSNLFGSSHLQQLEQRSGLESLLTDLVTGEITEGNFLIYAPDDRQDFPAEAGEDGVWFSGDEPTVTLAAGYTLATLPAEGAITLDRSPQLAMTTLERAEQKSPDFSDQGILESFNSLIDILTNRYAYTDLRGLDWEAIRTDYLPRVEGADAEGDMAAYYALLRELAISLDDTHVSATTNNPVLTQATAGGEQNNATVGASIFAAWDETEELPGERILVLSVGEESPAAEAGWVPGTEILTIDGDPIAERVAAVQLDQGIGTETVRLTTQARSVLNFPDGREVTIEYRLPDADEVLSATMVAGTYDVGQALSSSVAGPPVSFKRLGDYGVVRWSDFLHSILPKLAVLEEALGIEQNVNSGGMILDLRGNGGGWVTLYETMASYFFTADDPMPAHLFDSYFYDESLGERVKEFSPDYMISAPNPDFAYLGPVVVLVDQACASACEYFSQHLQELDRATIIGQYPSSGAGGSVDRVTMPGGITFQFTQGTTYFAGTQIPNLEAKGVVPDIRVPITLETELAKIQGEDPVLDAAVAFLDETSDRFAGTAWRWTATGDTSGVEMPVEHDGVYDITFDADGSLAVTADCNQAAGSYTRTEFDELTITLDATTMALCPGDSLSESFLQKLGSVKTFAFDGNRLLLFEISPDGGLSALILEAVEDTTASGAGAMDEAASLTEKALRNATYTLTEMFEEPVTLQDGSYMAEDGILTVDYMADSARYGDLDGDGVEDAVVVLMERGGGTNTNFYLAAQLNREGESLDAAALLVDGNIQIVDLAIEEGQVTLEVTTRGPGDANCCASYLTQRSFALREGMLTEVGEASEPVRVSADDLNGTSWTLVELDEGQPPLEEPPITIAFEDGSLAGSSGCNTYSADFTLSEDNPFIITIGPIIATRTSCPEPIMNQEAAYLDALQNASLWGYDIGKMAISHVEDGELPERLLFTEAARAATTSSVVPEMELLDECFFEIPGGLPFDCGTVTVPEFHGVDNGRSMRLGVVRLKSSSDTPAAPLFLAAGGPGGSLLENAAVVATLVDGGFAPPWAQLLSERDLVFFTPRGTAYADPALMCDENAFQPYLDTLSNGAPAEERQEAKVQSLQACMQTYMDAGVDFTAYNSVQNAHDVNALREALGYEQIVFYGESYGTLLAQHVMREFPEILTAVILDGTLPISAPTWVDRNDAKFQNALNVLIALCTADEACRTAYPDLGADLQAVYEKLQDEPFTFTFMDQTTTYDETLFSRALFEALYTPIFAASIPLAVDAVLNDVQEEDRLIGVLGAESSRLSQLSWPTHFAVVCAENPVKAYEEAQSLETPDYALVPEFVQADAFEYIEMCEFLDLPLLPDVTDEPIRSNLPVLMLNGAFDPITPALANEEVRQLLPNSFEVEFPAGGHVQVIGGNACAQEIVAAFVADPTSEPDSSCVAEREPLQFALPAEAPAGGAAGP